MIEKIRPLVSIIVPVYNAEIFLNKCIDSILTQTYRNIELLLIDDESKDNSGKICDEYASLDKRVRVIHKVNTGVAATRNIGLEEATGEYISFVDSDDYIAPNMLEVLVSKACEYDSDIVMCKYFIDRSGEISCSSMRYEEVYDGEEKIKNGLLYLYYTDYHNGLYSLWNKLIKKSVYSTNSISFDSTLKRGEDAWFVFQCLKHCSRIDFIPEPLYYYYQNESSIMHMVYDDQYEKWVDMRRRLIAENEQLGFDIDYDLFYKEFLYKVAVFCRMLAATNQKEKLKKIIADPFYINAAKYACNLPIHIGLLTNFVKNRMFMIAYCMCFIWAKLY